MLTDEMRCSNEKVHLFWQPSGANIEAAAVFDDSDDVASTPNLNC